MEVEPGSPSAGGEQEEQQGAVHLALSNLPALTALLQAIKISAKQLVSVVVAPEGVWLRWEDESKTLQSSVQLRSELFTVCECGPAKVTFGVNFAQLVDALAVLATAAAAPVGLRYPGPDGELQLEMTDGADEAARCVLYARISTLEGSAPSDLTDYWAEPVSYFLVAGQLLKEAVEDLEWPGGPVALRLARDPPGVALSAAGTGSLEVQLDASDLSGFQVAPGQAVTRYKYKNLKAACCNIPAGREHGGSISSKVSIDANGLLRVTHIVPLSGRGGGGGHHPPAFGSGLSMPAAFSNLGDTQAGTESSRVAVMQYVSLPVEDEE